MHMHEEFFSRFKITLFHSPFTLHTHTHIYIYKMGWQWFEVLPFLVNRRKSHRHLQQTLVLFQFVRGVGAYV